MQDGEQQRVEEVRSLERRNEELSTALKETEMVIKSQQITIDELNKHAHASELGEFRAWLEDVISTDALVPGLIDHGPRDGAVEGFDEFKSQEIEASGGVRELVLRLLEHWRNYVGIQVPSKIKGTSKAEQRFMQRVSDLVVDAHDQCRHAHRQLHEAELDMSRLRLAHQLSQARLKACVVHLHGYR